MSAQGGFWRRERLLSAIKPIDPARIVGKNADPSLTLAELIRRCEVATVGGDGGGLEDLFGMAVIGRERKPEVEARFRRWLHWGHAWAHSSVLARRKDIAPRLLDFVNDGDVTIVERVGDDVIEFADIVVMLSDAGLLPEKAAIGLDPAGIGAVVEELAARQIDPSPEAGIVVGIPQGWKLTNAIKTCERKFAGGEIVHGGRPFMAWQLGNAKAEPRGNAVVVTKQQAGSAKIDVLAATFNAVALMSLNPEAASASVYETRGFLVV